LAFKRSNSSNTLAYVLGPISPNSGSNVCLAQGSSPQSSSLTNTPRYLTVGVGDEKSSTFRYRFCFFSTGTSAHQYHGDTPMVSDMEKRPYAAPRRSLPATTSALA